MESVRAILKVYWNKNDAALTVSVPLDENGLGVKLRLQNFFNLTAEDMILKKSEDGIICEDELTLEELGAVPNECLDLLLEAEKEIRRLDRDPKVRRNRDVLSISMENGQTMNVEIIDDSVKKPFLGGYIDVRTKIEYHNATSQTERKIRKNNDDSEYVSKMIQTVPTDNKYQQSGHERATQTSKYISQFIGNDQTIQKLITPSGRYFTSAQLYDMLIQKIVIIQRSYRKWRAFKKINTVKNFQKVRKETETEISVPKNREDFQRLYAELENWRTQRDAELVSSAQNGGMDRKTLSKERAKLVLEEAKRLVSIDGSKDVLRRDAKRNLIRNIVLKAGEPKIWKNSKGQVTQLETQETIKAKKLGSVYLLLNSTENEDVGSEKRLDALLSLAEVLGEIDDCPLNREILSLAEREEDLLKRGMKGNDLSGLRQRIITLYLKLIRSPEHNPAIRRFSKFPIQTKGNTNSRSNQTLEFCKSCERYLSSNCFGERNSLLRCLQCRRLDNDARTRRDLSIYKDMLNFVKKEEEDRNAFHSPIFQLKDSDIRHIVINFWGSKSVLSGINDPYELCLVRWRKDEVWSPWNCALMTFEEAVVHSQLSNIYAVYQALQLERIKYRHTLAKIHFSNLQKSCKEQTSSLSTEIVIRGANCISN